MNHAAKISDNNDMTYKIPFKLYDYCFSTKKYLGEE